MYSITLMVFSAVLHRLVSQANFITKIRFLNFAGGPSERFGGGGGGKGELLSASYFISPILLCVIASTCMVIGLIWFGWKKLNNQMTMAGSCSALIAAACSCRRP